MVLLWHVESHVCQISGSCSEATLCCIFHLRDFHRCNNHTISAFCQEAGQAELIMFVLARFLAHWTTAIVLNSVLPLIEHSHFLALTQEIRFLSKGGFWFPSRESKERGIERKNKVVMGCEKRMRHMQARREYFGRGWMYETCAVQLNAGWLSILAARFSVKILVGCSETFSWLHFSDVCTYHLFRLRLKQLRFLSSDVSSLWP